MLCRAVAFVLVCVLAAGEFPARAARVSVVGVVSEAMRANLASANVSAGATVYDGDSLSTATDGLLRVRSGAAQFYLAGQSGVRMHSLVSGALVQLTGGTMVFSAANSTAMDVQVAQAHIRPATNDPTVAQISIAGPKSMDVHARRGALIFSYNGESQLVAEGFTYRFVLDPTDEELAVSAAAKAFPDQKLPRPQGKPRRGFLYLIIGATAFVTFLAVGEALESPSKP